MLQEILHRYSALNRHDLARVYDLFVAICPQVFDVTLADTDRARDLLTQIRGLSARDAVHAAVMLNRGIEWIATFDSGFDRVSGIQAARTPPLRPVGRRHYEYHSRFKCSRERAACSGFISRSR